MAAIQEPKYKQYLVAGRRHPSEKEPSPRIFRMRVFATNEQTAKSRFWYFMSQLNRLNKTAGEIVALTKISERHPGKIKNFGIWYRYDSRTGTHNSYKEFRDVTVNGAVSQLYQELGARHRTRFRGVQIIKINELKVAELKRKTTQTFVEPVKFPLPHRVLKTEKKFKKTFGFSKPNTCF